MNELDKLIKCKLELDSLFEKFEYDIVLKCLDKDLMLEYLNDKGLIEKYVKEEFSEYDLAEFLTFYHGCHVFHSDIELDDYVKENSPTLNSGLRLSSNYMNETMTLIVNITEREGWNYLHDYIEPLKQKLNLI